MTVNGLGTFSWNLGTGPIRFSSAFSASQWYGLFVLRNIPMGFSGMTISGRSPGAAGFGDLELGTSMTMGGGGGGGGGPGILGGGGGGAGPP